MERLKWWIQKEFKVLPTEQRFMDLTHEQMQVMLAHHKLDMKPAPKAVNDPDYDKDAPPAQERYDDPDFDKAWEGDDNGEESTDIVPENPPDDPVQDEVTDDVMPSFEDRDEWQEV